VPLSAAEKQNLGYPLNLLASSKPDCWNDLRKHIVVGLDYGEIADKENLIYASARIRIAGCPDPSRPDDAKTNSRLKSALQKLGQRLRAGVAQNQPAQEKDIDTGEAIRE
jgi:hypothetical protein